MQKLADTLRNSPPLRQLVVELAICGKIKHTNRHWAIGLTDPLLQVPPLSLVPRLHSLRLADFDNVLFSGKTWAQLYPYKNITELHLHRCHLQASSHLEQLVFQFPRLNTLTLDSVRWQGDRERVAFGQSPEYRGRTVHLQSLRICNPYEYAPLLQWLSLRGAVAVRHLELVRFDVYNLRPAATYVRALEQSLESLTLGYNLPAFCDHGERRIDLFRHKKLRSLSLQLYDCQDEYVRWVNTLLLSALDCPLERIAISFTLDDRKTLWTESWNTLYATLSAYWSRTLKEVAFTHFAMPNFLQNVELMIRDRFVELRERGILSVTVVRSQDV
ncbi:hypothetical protein BN946_scf184976.g23 [Trametes cinnabarina]|uniref:F-box domain-containing protein n=1 Tax=Pycnoporus cinnabarinus TaxID=5643 RepID=A0A060SAM3_PYCCI|nr:hypothetical protein BN946_scf184976.g23 [Trametes cinnabarina]